MQAQAADFVIEHSDPATCKCGVAIELGGKSRDGNLQDGRVDDGQRIAVVLGRFQACFAHEPLARALLDHGLSLQSSALQGDFN